MVDGGEQSSPSFLQGEPMTIQTLIDKVQVEKPNSFPDDKILQFINEIEQDVSEELREEDEFVPYTEIDDTELKAPAPYDKLYVSYLKAQIDYANEEYPSYQLNAEQHNQDFADFANFVVRTGRSIVVEIPSRFKNVF